MENLEVRVVRTEAGWRVDRHAIGAMETETLARARTLMNARQLAIANATRFRASGEFGNVRLMIEELF